MGDIEVKERTCPHCGQRLVPRVLEVPLSEGVPVSMQMGWHDCQCAEAAAQRQREEQQRRAWAATGTEEQRRAALISAGIPTRYWQAELSRKLKDHVAGGLWLWGDASRGKTHQACAIGRLWLARGRRVKFSTMLALSSRMRSTWTQRGESEESVLDAYLACDLLILDDLGTEHLDGRVLDELFRLVDGRYGRRGTTIVTSNWRPQALAARIAEKSDDVMAEKVVARLVEMCPPFEWVDRDWRLGR